VAHGALRQAELRSRARHASVADSRVERDQCVKWRQADHPASMNEIQTKVNTWRFGELAMAIVKD